MPVFGSWLGVITECAGIIGRDLPSQGRLFSDAWLNTRESDNRGQWPQRPILRAAGYPDYTRLCHGVKPAPLSVAC